jgi:hypothetical protein
MSESAFTADFLQPADDERFRWNDEVLSGWARIHSALTRRTGKISWDDLNAVVLNLPIDCLPIEG